MPTLLQLDFPFEGPWGEDMTEVFRPLAQSIATEPGLLWKIWTENPATHEAGGIYLFTDRQSAENYLEMHSKRLQKAGVTEIRGKFFAVNEALSRIDRGPLP